MSRKYEVTAITGKYTDKNGQEKSRYQTIGAVIETKNGPTISITGPLQRVRVDAPVGRGR